MNTRTGFTLIEILLVVIILGILAATVIPLLASASDDARASALRDDLRTVRVQCEIYRFEHNGNAPGYPADGGAADAATFMAQMLNSTDIDGDPGVDFGSYLLRFPINAINSKSTVRVVTDAEAEPVAASDAFGWVYTPRLLHFHSDSIGSDAGGQSFFTY